MAPACRILPALLACHVAFAAHAAGRTTVAIGDATIAYDPDLWRVTSTAIPENDDPAEAGEWRLLFYCVAEECGDNRPFAWVAAELVDSASPASNPLSEHRVARWNSDPLVLQSATGVRFRGATEYSSCRAYTPSANRVQTVAGGLTYTFATGTNFGCSGIEGVPDPLFAELVAGFSLRP